MNQETRLKIALEIIQNENERSDQKRKRQLLAYVSSCIVGGLFLYSLILLAGN